MLVWTGKDGVTKQTCREPQKDISMLTVRRLYRPMMAYTPLENWEQTGTNEKEKIIDLSLEKVTLYRIIDW